MGPIRRRLAAFITLLPTPALAEVCDKERPEWDGVAASALDGMLDLLATAPSLILIVASLLALRFKSVWGGLATVVGWTIWVSVINSPAAFPARAAAIEEGCIGSNTLFIALAIAICVGIVVYTAPRASLNKNGEN